MKKEIVKFLVLLTVALGAAPAYSAFWQWSKTASNNATADPSINFAEGMSPSAVNDSARALMARAAEYRDDISGALTLAGTSTAYTLTTNQGLNATPVTGQMIAFTPNVTNGVAATLTTDGGGTFPLQVTAGTALPAATIVAGTPYRAKFSGTAWVLEAGYGNPYAVPLGSILLSTLTTAPNSNFVAPSGQCLSTTTYNTYWVALGSPASGSCAGGQFQIIDMRGYVPAALDTLNASAANRLTNSATGCGTAMTTVGAVCANGTQGDAITLAQLPNNIPVSVTSTSNALITGTGASNNFGFQGGTTIFGGVITAFTFGSGTQTSTGLSTHSGGTARPRVAPTIGLIPYLRVI
jgi:hypothetical protein